jgi:hypothetical protein
MRGESWGLRRFQWVIGPPSRPIEAAPRLPPPPAGGGRGEGDSAGGRPDRSRRPAAPPFPPPQPSPAKGGGDPCARARGSSACPLNSRKGLGMGPSIGVVEEQPGPGFPWLKTFRTAESSIIVRRWPRTHIALIRGLPSAVCEASGRGVSPSPPDRGLRLRCSRIFSGRGSGLRGRDGSRMTR